MTDTGEPGNVELTHPEHGFTVWVHPDAADLQQAVWRTGRDAGVGAHRDGEAEKGFRIRTYDKDLVVALFSAYDVAVDGVGAAPAMNDFILYAVAEDNDPVDGEYPNPPEYMIWYELRFDAASLDDVTAALGELARRRALGQFPAPGATPRQTAPAMRRRRRLIDLED